MDVFDAITTKRSYQRAIPTDQAAEVLRDQVRRGWRSADVVEPFIAIVESGRLARFAESTVSAGQSLAE